MLPPELGQTGRGAPPHTREQAFGWLNRVDADGEPRYLRRGRNKLWVELNAAAYNLPRLANIEGVGP